MGQPEYERRRLMKKDILTEDNIILGQKISDKWEGIRLAGEILVRNGYVTQGYVDDMIKRERDSSVYIGNHVAIPHGLVDSGSKILNSGISFVQVPDGVSFGDEDAYMIIGVAGKGEEHMGILGSIAMACMDLENVNKLRTTTDKQEIIRILLSNSEM